MNKKRITNSVISGILSAVMVLTGIPATAITSFADPVANKVSFTFSGVDADGEAVEFAAPAPSLEAIDIADGMTGDGYDYEGYNREGYNREGYDKFGYDVFTKVGFQK